MLLKLVGVVLGGGKSETWGDDTLDAGGYQSSCSGARLFQNLRRVVGQVQEQGGSLHRTVLLEITSEESAGLQVDTHSTKDDGEVVVVSIVNALVWSDKTSLSTNLSSDFVVRKTSGREDWNLLTTGNGVHGVDSGDTSGDHLLGIFLDCVSFDIPA